MLNHKNDTSTNTNGVSNFGSITNLISWMKASWVQVIFSLIANTLQLIFSCHTKYRLSLYSSYNIIILWRCNYCQKFRTHNNKILKVLKVDGCNVVLSLNHLLEKCPPTEYYKSSLNQINQLTIWSFTIFFSFSYEDKKNSYMNFHGDLQNCYFKWKN